MCRYEGFATSEEAQLVGNVLNYYDQCDGDTVAKLCKNPLFKYLDNDVSGNTVCAPQTKETGMSRERKEKNPL